MIGRDIRLQVLVCTMASRLPYIDTSVWPVVAGVSYMVSCQNPDGIEPDLKPFEGRADIDIIFFDDCGLSVNRNHAFDAATAPYVLIADDDTTFHAMAFEALVAVFDADSSLDYVTMRAEQPDGRVYPPDGFSFDRPWPFYSPMSVEIAFRLESLRRSRLRFNELLGIGAPYLACGEEELLLIDARRRGLKGRFCDIVIVTHPQATSSVRLAVSPGIVRAKGALMRVDRGMLGALLRLPLEARRSPMPFFKALRCLAQGYIYSIKHGL